MAEKIRRSDANAKGCNLIVRCLIARTLMARNLLTPCAGCMPPVETAQSKARWHRQRRVMMPHTLFSGPCPSCRRKSRSRDLAPFRHHPTCSTPSAMMMAVPPTVTVPSTSAPLRTVKPSSIRLGRPISNP